MRHLGRAFQMRIADISFAVHAEEDGAELEVEPYWEPFLITEQENCDIQIRVHGAKSYPCTEYRELFRGTHRVKSDHEYASESLWRLHQSGQKYMIETASLELDTFPNRIVVFDTNCDVWEVFIPGNVIRDPRAPIDPLPLPLGPIILSRVLSQHNGVCLHACGVLSGSGNGLLFCGQSGIGKSTMAKLWQRNGALVISDDRMILRKVDCDFYIYNTPRQGEDRCAKALLSRVFLLQQSSSNQVLPLKKTMAVAQLMALCLQDYSEKRLVDHHLNVLTELTENVPICALGFLPEDSVVHLVEQQLSSGEGYYGAI